MKSHYLIIPLIYEKIYASNLGISKIFISPPSEALANNFEFVEISKQFTGSLCSYIVFIRNP